MGEQTPRIRRQPIPDDAHLVVRGDEDLSVQERMAACSCGVTRRGVDTDSRATTPPMTMLSRDVA